MTVEEMRELMVFAIAYATSLEKFARVDAAARQKADNTRARTGRSPGELAAMAAQFIESLRHAPSKDLQIYTLMPDAKDTGDELEP